MNLIYAQGTISTNIESFEYQEYNSIVNLLYSMWKKTPLLEKLEK